MNQDATMLGPAVYELTVEGALGAVLRAGLQPHDACETQTCTIMSARGAVDRDLVDLMFFLHSKGLSVEQATKVTDDKR